MGIGHLCTASDPWKNSHRGYSREIWNIPWGMGNECDVWMMNLWNVIDRSGGLDDSPTMNNEGDILISTNGMCVDV